MKLPFTSYKDFMIQRHGAPLHRVPIDFNFGCPNREADGSGGCTFCNLRGSAAVQTLGTETVEDQMQVAIDFARRRYGAKKFMAYIQAFSATFGEAQQPLYLNLLDQFPFTAVSIGTRPDCITPQALDFLIELNRHIEVWVELGVQTIHDTTLERVNRGHDWASSEQAIELLHQANIPIALHAILGLPGETATDFQATADRFAQLPIQAVKIHNLHIEKGTTLALEHALTPLPVFNEYTFGEHLIDFIRRMPSTLPIMRLTTDTIDHELIAPRWQMDKQKFRNYIITQMEAREWRQGDLCPSNIHAAPPVDLAIHPVITDDGTTTFWNEHVKEHYHTRAGARLEAEEKYVQPARLSEKLNQHPLHLLDICFGLGYNSHAALNASLGTNHPLHITALEMDRRIVRHAAQTLPTDPKASFNWNATLLDLYEHGSATPLPNQPIRMHWGDARHTITLLPDASVDLIFLDAFSSPRNSECWTLHFFAQIKRIMRPNAQLFTYATAGPIRAGLMQAGFHIGETNAVERPHGGTQATLDAQLLLKPLTTEELHALETTTRGIPFHDPQLVWTHREIIRDREQRIIEFKS
jgi:radical SAM protein (TIGR01212 family)